MARSHSLNLKIQSIIDDQMSNEVTTISVRGKEGTGKTTLAKNIAHAIHTKAGKLKPDKSMYDEYTLKHIRQMTKGYLILLLTADDLMHFREILESVPKNKNLILIFDDLSFQKQLKNIKSDLTKVRHLRNGDVKVVLIYNFHYSKSTDKYIRDTGYIFITSISAEEIENLKVLFGRTHRHSKLVNTFNSIYHKFRRNRHITLNLAPQKKTPVFVKYVYSNPFRIGLFFDSHAASFFVFPSSEAFGVDACTICNSEQIQRDDAISNDMLVDWLKMHYTDASLKQAARVLSYMQYGYDIRKDVQETRALGTIRRLEENGILNVDKFILKVFNIDELQKAKNPYVQTALAKSFYDTFHMDGFGLDAKRLKAITEENKEEI